MHMYWLPDHVHACAAGEQTVILDLKADRYLALDAANARALTSVVHGWPAPALPMTAGDELQERAESIARRMCERGLLTANNPRSPAPAAAPTRKCPPPAVALIEEDVLSRPAVRLRNIWDFAAATITAAASLRWRSFHDTVMRVQRRKQRIGQEGSAFDFDHARELVTTFDALRPFFFTSKDGCLLHALALLEFLSHNGLYPDWVFGVKTSPFVAHCWIQQGEVVLNDAPERVRAYTPIMVV